MNKLKALMLSLILISPVSFAGDTYGDWSYSSELESYISTDIINHKLNAMIGKRETGLKFGLFLPYEQCYFPEKNVEPFGSIWMLGSNYNFQMQCLGKSKAVVFPERNIHSDIISSLINEGHLCMLIEDNKFCFSGNGIKELQDTIDNKS